MVSFSDITNDSNVLPNDKSANSGGLTMIYESKGGAKKKKVRKPKQQKTIKIDSSVDKPLQRGSGGKGSGKKSKKSKSKSKKSRSCKEKVINIYM